MTERPKEDFWRKWTEAEELERLDLLRSLPIFRESEFAVGTTPTLLNSYLEDLTTYSDKTKVIPVVAGCITVPAGKGHPETRFLLHRKTEPRNPELLGKWEFPGGMIEYGESPKGALARELEEELGRSDFQIGPLIYAQTNLYEDRVHYLVLFYKCKLLERLPSIKDCEWFPWSKLKTLDSLPGLLEAAEICMLGGKDENRT